MVSGLIQSLGLGDLSRLGTPCELPKGPKGPCVPKPSIETPFSERNSSKSTYWKILYYQYPILVQVYIPGVILKRFNREYLRRLKTRFRTNRGQVLRYLRKHWFAILMSKSNSTLTLKTQEKHSLCDIWNERFYWVLYNCIRNRLISTRII